MVRSKFDKLKDEVNADLGIFAGDLVGILEKTSESHPEWKICLEDLLVISRKCAQMSPGEFWIKCEGIVQNLDDRRQELHTSTLKQLHTRLLFILSRCTRLVHFQKENGHEEDHLTLHQISDIGVYNILGSSIGGKETVGRDTYNNVLEQEKNHASEEVSTAKSGASSTGSFKMSSWRKFPCAAEKNKKGHGSVGSPCKDKLEDMQYKKEISIENTEAPMKSERVNWGVWDQHHMAYEDSLICRICEVEIPTVHVEQHSRICTIADRCDLKGLTVNERLERVAETLEKVLESWTPSSSETGVGSPEVVRACASSVQEDLDGMSPKGSEDTMDCVHAPDNSFLVDEFHNSMNMLPYDGRALTLVQSMKASSVGSLTPRSPLVTPRMTQIELLLSGRRAISELESYQQVTFMMLNKSFFYYCH